MVIVEAIVVELLGSYEIFYCFDFRECKGLFWGVEFIIGMWFYSLIMVVVEGSVCFVFSYDFKVSCLIVEVGLLGWELVDLFRDSNEFS